MNLSNLIKQGMSKTVQTPCSFHVCAIGFDAHDKYLGMTRNLPFGHGKGRGKHAEANLIKKYYKRGLKNIIIFRTNKTGGFLPIHPCKTCQRLANKLNIKIQSLEYKTLDK